MSPDHIEVKGREITSPSMFTRPSDPPIPLPSIHGDARVTTLHAEWSRINSMVPQSSSIVGRIRQRGARYINRITGRADHAFLADLIRAVDAIAERCDELSERLSSNQLVVDEVASILGEEVTQLRAAVARLNVGAPTPTDVQPSNE